MTKQFKTTTYLADNNGAVWVEGQFTQTQVKRFINSYKRAGIFLTAYGSPDQVKKQVEEISAFFDRDERSRPFREAGRLEVIGVGF